MRIGAKKFSPLAARAAFAVPLALACWAAAQSYTVTFLDAPNFSTPAGMSATGNVTGSNGINVDHAFLYSNGSMRYLGTLGGDTSDGLGVNDAGQVVGFSYITNDTAYHAFLYSNGTMQDIGTMGRDQQLCQEHQQRGDRDGLFRPR